LDATSSDFALTLQTIQNIQRVGLEMPSRCYASKKALYFLFFSHIKLLAWSNTMKSKFVLSIDDVQTILTAARAEAEKNNWGVTIAVSDDGGHILGLLRLDSAPAMSSYIAPAKANCSALGRRESKMFEDVINGGRISFLSAPKLEGMLEGGVPIVVDGQCIGAVGVSGVKSEQDVQIAKAGIAALTL
jgi:uncharacterized protein GlcG (DUF336 family)